MGVSATGSIVILWKFVDVWNWTKGRIQWLISQYSWNISPVIIHYSMKSSNFLKKMCPGTFPFLASVFEALYCWIYSVLKRNCCSLRLVTKAFIQSPAGPGRLAIDSWHNILGNSPCSRLHYFCLLALSFLQLWVLSRSSSSLMRSVGWKYSQCNALPSTKAWPIAAWERSASFCPESCGALWILFTWVQVLSPWHLNVLKAPTLGPVSVACKMWSQSGSNLRLLMNAIAASPRLTAFS